jgi:hypothetical protein
MVGPANFRLIAATAWCCIALSACGQAPAEHQATSDSRSSFNPAPTATAAASPDEVWEAFYIDGHKVGHSFTRTEPYEEDGRELLRITSGAELIVDRFQQSSSQKVTIESIETPAGELVRFESELVSGGSPMGASGAVAAGELTIQLGDQRQAIPWKKEYKGVLGIEQSLEREPMRPGEKRTIVHLFPLIHQLATVEMTAVGEEEVKLLDETRKLLRIECVSRMSGGAIESTLWTDEAGRKWKTELPGARQVAFRTSRERALEKEDGPAYDLGLAPIVKLDKPIERPEETTEIVYRASLKSGDIDGVFADDGTQDVTTIDERTCDVTVRSVAQTDDKEPAPTEDDLAPSSLVQSNDRKVMALALAGAPQRDTDPAGTAQSLAQFVNRQMRSNASFAQAIATAAETAASLEGDCTEHAMLLAALCRARGIPARVAIGLVYHPQQQGFAYHMWTESWTGDRWISLDATRTSGATSAAYLKLANSNLKGVDAYAAFLPVQQVLGRLALEIRSVKYAH